MTQTDPIAEARRLLREEIAASSYEFTKDYQRKRGAEVGFDLPWSQLPDLQKRFGYAQVDWLLANVPALGDTVSSPAAVTEAVRRILSYVETVLLNQDRNNEIDDIVAGTLLPVKAMLRRALASNPESKPAAGVTEALQTALAPFLHAAKHIDWYVPEAIPEICFPVRGARISADDNAPSPFTLTPEDFTRLAAALASAAPAAPGTIPAETKQLFDLGRGEAFLFNPGGRFHGWVFKRHPDGYYVSHGKVPTIPEPWGPEALAAAPAVSQPPADTRENGNG